MLYPEGEAKEMVFAYMEDTFGIKKYTHILEPDYRLSDESVHPAMSAFARMAAGEPLQYVTGKAYFYGREFHVTSDTLIPRPETELLCREVLEAAGRSGLNDKGNTLKILDLCTGSGCIAWTLALESPGAEVLAVDISDGALSVAAMQDFADEMSLSKALRPTFIKADVLQAPDAALGQFDMIVSNPPYVMDSEKALMRKNVLEHEPHLALFVPDEDPLKFYRAVASWAALLLNPDGSGIVEINEALGQETAEVFREAGFSKAEVLKDLSERDRFVRFSR